jgi:hypothetical protein
MREERMGCFMYLALHVPLRERENDNQLSHVEFMMIKSHQFFCYSFQVFCVLLFFLI